METIFFLKQAKKEVEIEIERLKRMLENKELKIIMSVEKWENIKKELTQATEALNEITAIILKYEGVKCLSLKK